MRASEEAPKSGEPPQSSKPSDASRKRGKRTGSKRTGQFITLKIIAVWTLVFALIIFVARMKWHAEPEETPPTKVAAAVTSAVTEEDAVLLQDAARKCIGAFSGYLAAGTPEERSQFVLAPITTAARMSRFYSLNPSTNLDPKTLTLIGQSLLHLPGAKGIETHWKSQDGKQVDAVFREENGEWRLDWDHFARFSDYPWSLFLAGTGPSEGEFRLLARERLAEERKNEEALSIVLYAPRFSQPTETGFQSPEFLVSRNSREGLLLDAAFKLARDGKRVFGSQLPSLNPDGMIRVRVKVRRIEKEMDRKFELTGVTACHWYSVEDPGVEPAVPAEEKPAEN